MGRMGKKSSHLLLIFSFFFFNTIKGSHPGGASLRLLREAWKKLKNGSWEKKICISDKFQPCQSCRITALGTATCELIYNTGRWRYRKGKATLKRYSQSLRAFGEVLPPSCMMPPRVGWEPLHCGAAQGQEGLFPAQLCIKMTER